MCRNRMECDKTSVREERSLRQLCIAVFIPLVVLTLSYLISKFLITDFKHVRERSLRTRSYCVWLMKELAHLCYFSVRENAKIFTTNI